MENKPRIMQQFKIKCNRLRPKWELQIFKKTQIYREGVQMEKIQILPLQIFSIQLKKQHQPTLLLKILKPCFNNKILKIKNNFEFILNEYFLSKFFFFLN
jgi:hypothetical protein